MHGRIARVVAAGLVGMAVGAGYVHAQGTASSDPIHACKDNASGVLHVRSTCTAGETEVVWNEPGAAGATGAQGPSGDRGPDGAPSSLQGRVVTGGHTVDSGGDPREYQIIGDHPVENGSGWTVQMVGYYSGYRLLVFALCAPQAGGAR